jgi:2-polyprenyl-3-methyl-5-hydroxy-6-metoxy-1,4-benzoquinol methylase
MAIPVETVSNRNTNAAQVIDWWTEHLTYKDNRQIYWRALPQVKAYVNRRSVGGEPYADWVECCAKKFQGSQLPVPRILSLGSGSGALERRLAELNAFQACDAYDITEAAVSYARQRAEAAGYHHINYAVADMTKYAFPDAAYDAVWVEDALHHLEALELVCEKIVRTLKPDGWLFFNEYVGPTRFAFTRRQKQVITAAHALIPRAYLKSFIPGGTPYQEVPQIPNPVEVAEADPSEAVRSKDVLRVVEQYFDIHMLNDGGGTVLQYLLAGIAGNFTDDDPDAHTILDMLIHIEEALVDVGSLESDFVVVAATPKKHR